MTKIKKIKVHVQNNQEDYVLGAVLASVAVLGFVLVELHEIENGAQKKQLKDFIKTYNPVGNTDTQLADGSYIEVPASSL